MAMIKVSTSVFSKIKTVVRALRKSSQGDEIRLAAGKYKESITIQQSVTIKAKLDDHVILEGVMTIPKSSQVTFENLTIYPTVQLYVEGDITLKNCIFDGMMSNVFISLNNGQASIENCHFIGAKDVAVTLSNNSNAIFENCTFKNNGKSHLLLENSTTELINCELLKCRHAIWVRSESTVKTKNSKIHHHSGTQIIVQGYSTYMDVESAIENGDGNGIYATEHSNIQLTRSIIQHHSLPQLWLQKSKIQLSDCQVQNGKESGLMLRELSEGSITNTVFTHHKIANIQLTLESLLNLTDSEITNCQGVGIQVKEKSIMNIMNTTITENVLPQLFITDKSICSIRDTTIQSGKQVGVYVEKQASCSIVSSTITEHSNTAVTIIDAELFILDTVITRNLGNGILTVNKAVATIENCLFKENDMPHIAGKEKSSVTISQCEFKGGKSIFMVEKCHLDVKESRFLNGTGVQIEVANQTKAFLFKTTISGGYSNAIKALRDATIHINESQIVAQRMPQIIVNDSSLILKNSELLHGEKNGLIIENHSEAFIQDSFISNHHYPQLWIDLESTVELNSTQLTEGHESDIYVQNNSTLYASNCIVHNDKFNFNIQAVNNSKINLVQTAVQNSMGEMFYSENNSEINQSFDEVN